MVIKYRCWDNVKKHWHIADPDNLVSILTTAGRGAMRVVAPSEYILVLYTGFDDKHATDVYPGDILDNKVYVDWDILRGQWVVREKKPNGSYWDFSHYKPSEHEITGTIFEEEGWPPYEDITNEL